MGLPVINIYYAVVHKQTEY